jgi:4-aminobutyrate aminotransferase-like enzyme
VRSLGAMAALELCHDRDPARPAKELLERVLAVCRERGVLVIPASRNVNVLRLLCPLVISDADLDQALTVIESAVMSLNQKASA